MARVIFLCEKIVSNYGVDRTIINIANDLAKEHQVTVVTSRYSESCTGIKFDIKLINFSHLTFKDFWEIDKEYSRAALAFIHSQLYRNEETILISCGWPFIQSAFFIDNIQSDCVRKIFFDFGLVPRPVDDFNQLELRKLRYRFLQYFDQILTISEFLSKSDICFEAPNLEKTVIRLSGQIIQDMQRIDPKHNFSNEENEYFIFLLGRPDFDHKRAQDLPRLLEKLRESGMQVSAKILAGENHPLAREPGIICLGNNVSDEKMFQEILASDFAVSLSVWEGYNLPLAESQKYIPTYCLSVGAHAEVVADVNQLCQDLEDMAGKIVSSINGRSKTVIKPAGLDRTWSDVSEEFDRLLKKRPYLLGDLAVQPKILLVQATNAYFDDANTGVVRVTRALLAEFIQQKNLVIVPIIFNGHEFLVPNDLGNLINFTSLAGFFNSALSPWKNYAGCTVDELLDSLKTEVLVEVFNSEVIVNRELNYVWTKLRKRVHRITFLVHDLIPLKKPELVSPSVEKGFLSYLDTLTNADKLLTNSETTLIEYRAYANEKNLTTELSYLGLGVEVAAPVGKVLMQNQVLMVSTLEPRKNHKNVLKAFAIYNSSRLPIDQLKLFLVGNSYDNESQLMEFVSEYSSSFDWIQYLGIVSDSELNNLYETSSFTIFGSTIEGFGLPIVESLARGTPVLCHNQGVMAEHAIEGGCYTTDMNSVESIVQSLEALSDRSLIQALRNEALSRRFDSWGEVCDRILQILQFNIEGKVEFPISQHSVEFELENRRGQAKSISRLLKTSIIWLIHILKKSTLLRKLVRKMPKKLKYRLWKISN